MSFQQGIAMFEIVKLLYKYEEEDIFYCCDNNIDRCSFYGRKEVLVWLLAQSRDYMHTAAEHAQLAINIARNSQHNGPKLARAVLANIDPSVALKAKSDNNVTLSHRIASRLGGGFAHEVQGSEKLTQYLDEGFGPVQHPSEKEMLSRNGWRLFLREFDLSNADLHTISDLNLTPLMMGFKSLVFIWNGLLSKEIKTLSMFLQLWLLTLQQTGVDILQYGIKERHLHHSGLVCKDFSRRQRTVKVGGHGKTTQAVNSSYGTLRLIAIEPAALPADWRLWWSEPTDEFAGEFWGMCERVTPTTPGAWVNESEI